MKEDKLYLIHIAECIRRIELYTRDGRESFIDSTLQQDAVIRNLEIIGEAVKHLSPELRRSHTGVPWRRIAGLRDVLIHDYLSVDLDEVWNISERDLPDLKRRISSVLEGLERS
jgi:uncharacterized protein with HEPN domain